MGWKTDNDLTTRIDSLIGNNQMSNLGNNLNGDAYNLYTQSYQEGGKVVKNENALLDTLQGIPLRPGRVSRRTGKTLGSPQVDYKAMLEYLKNNYTLDEIPQVLIDNPKVLELIQGNQIKSAEMQGHARPDIIEGKDIEFLLNMVKPHPREVSVSTITKDYLKKFAKGKVNKFLHDELGFGMKQRGAESRVSSKQDRMSGEMYVESTGYYDPDEWGTHKEK